MKGSVRWPRQRFLSAICFVWGGILITTWLEGKQRLPLTTSPVRPCWGFHVGSPASNPSQKSSRVQVKKQDTQMTNALTSPETPLRKTTNSSSSFDRSRPSFPVGPPADVHALLQRAVAVKSRQQQLTSAARTAAGSATSKGLGLPGSLHPEENSFNEGEGQSSSSPRLQGPYTDGKRTSLKSFFEGGESKLWRPRGSRGVKTAPVNGGGDEEEGVLDLLSPAQLLDTRDYAESLRALVHGTGEQEVPVHQGINDENSGSQSVLAQGACTSRDRSRTDYCSKCNRTNSESSEALRSRKQHWPTTATPNTERKPAALVAAAAHVRRVGEAFNEQEQSCGCKAKRKAGLSRVPTSSDGLIKGSSPLVAWRRQRYKKNGGRDVVSTGGNVPVAFAQAAEAWATDRVKQEEKGSSAAKVFVSDLSTRNAADGVSVRQANMPIATHADALLQQSVSATDSEEAKEAAKGREVRIAETGEAQGKVKRERQNSRSLLLQRRGGALAPAQNHIRRPAKEGKTAGEIPQKQRSENHHLEEASLFEKSSHPSGAKNLDTAADEKKSAGGRPVHAGKDVKDAGRKRPSALLETAAGAASEEEVEEEEGEEFGEGAGEEESVGTKEDAQETAKGETSPAAADKEKQGGGAEGEAAAKEEHDSQAAEGAAAGKSAGAAAPATEKESHTKEDFEEEEEEESSVEEKEEEKPEKKHHVEKTVSVTIVTEGKQKGEDEEKGKTAKKPEAEKKPGELKEERKELAEEASKKHVKSETEKIGHAETEEKKEQKVAPPAATGKEAGEAGKTEKAEEKDALERQWRAEEKLEEPSQLLEEHRLSGGGPRGVTRFREHSYMNAQDELQHRQLQEASEMATRLTQHLQRQNELKVQEMHLKRREMAHINQLRHFEHALQAVISTVWKKLDALRASLKLMMRQTKFIGEKFLRRTGHRVLRPEEVPLTVRPTPAEQQQLVAKTSHGISDTECPTDCLPSACDNKPATRSQCFRYTESAGGGGFRTCEPFSDPDTATCRQGFTRCAMAAPVRGAHYELFESTPKHPLPQPLIIHGKNLSTCLRLLTVHEQTRCSPDSSRTVEETLKDAQSIRAQPAPHVLDEDAVLFEDVQVPQAGHYKLCLLQYWVPPGAKKDDKVYVLGIDEVGTLAVLPPPDDSVLAKLNAEEEEREREKKAKQEEEERGEETEKATKEKKEAEQAEKQKDEMGKEAQEKMVESATAGRGEKEQSE